MKDGVGGGRHDDGGDGRRTLQSEGKQPPGLERKITGLEGVGRGRDAARPAKG